MAGVCSIEGCLRPASAKGWCQRHYYALRPTPPCTVEGCAEPSYRRGWCSKHYAKWRRYGDPTFATERVRARCSVDECGKPAHGQGLCLKHYMRLQRTGRVDLVPLAGRKDPLTGTGRKTCRTCKEGKPRSEFSHSDVNADGLAGVCKPCWTERQKQVRSLSYDQFRHRERGYLLQKYGLSHEDFDRILAEQGGTCAICQGPPNGRGSHFAVDHNHATGKVRGLLCGSCNGLLGLAQDDEARLLAAIGYLRRHSAVGTGVG